MIATLCNPVCGGDHLNDEHHGFNDELFNRFKKELLGSNRNITLPANLSSLSAEKKAAICFVMRKQHCGAKNIMEAMEVLREPSGIVDKLWMKYPGSNTVFCLKFQYTLFPDRKYHPYFELAYPLVTSFNDKQVLEPCEKEIQRIFYSILYAMLSTYKANRKAVTKRGRMSRGDYMLFSFNATVPLPEDVLTWKTILADFGERNKWPSEKMKRIREHIPGIDGEISLEQAWERLGRLCSEGLSRRYITARKAKQEAHKLYDEAEQRYRTFVIRRNATLNPYHLPEEKLLALQKLEHAVLEPSENWKQHKKLIEFYIANNVIKPEHPLSDRAGMADKTGWLLAKAYYQVIVLEKALPSGMTRESRQYQQLQKKTGLLLKRVLKEVPDDPVANAVMARYLAHTGSVTKARFHLKKAKQKSPHLDEIEETRSIINNR